MWSFCHLFYINMKKLSRQRIWQLAQIEAGKCSKCNNKLFKSELCKSHYDSGKKYQFEKARNRLGIPLGWPKGKHFNGGVK